MTIQHMHVVSISYAIYRIYCISQIVCTLTASSVDVRLHQSESMSRANCDPLLFCLSGCPSVRIYLCLFVCLSVCPYITVSICMYLCLFVCPSLVCSSAYLCLFANRIALQLLLLLLLFLYPLLIRLKGIMTCIKLSDIRRQLCEQKVYIFLINSVSKRVYILITVRLSVLTPISSILLEPKL